MKIKLNGFGGGLLALLSGLGVIGIITFFICMLLIGGWLWPYTLGTIGLFFGKKIVLAFWQGALLGLIPFTGPLTIPAAVVTWILSLFLL